MIEGKNKWRAYIFFANCLASILGTIVLVGSHALFLFSSPAVHDQLQTTSLASRLNLVFWDIIWVSWAIWPSLGAILGSIIIHRIFHTIFLSIVALTSSVASISLAVLVYPSTLSDLQPGDEYVIAFFPPFQFVCYLMILTITWFVPTMTCLTIQEVRKAIKIVFK